MCFIGFQNIVTTKEKGGMEKDAAVDGETEETERRFSSVVGDFNIFTPSMCCCCRLQLLSFGIAYVIWLSFYKTLLLVKFNRGNPKFSHLIIEHDFLRPSPNF